MVLVRLSYLQTGVITRLFAIGHAIPKFRLFPILKTADVLYAYTNSI